MGDDALLLRRDTRAAGRRVAQRGGDGVGVTAFARAAVAAASSHDDSRPPENATRHRPRRERGLENVVEASSSETPPLDRGKRLARLVPEHPRGGDVERT